MQLSYEYATAAVVGLMLCFVRMTGMVALNPFLARRNVPSQIRVALALGLATAGSGLATILFPGPVTWLIQSWGLTAAFWCEGTFVLLMALLLFLLVRDEPAQLGLAPY